jgi:hypothetical protein
MSLIVLTKDGQVMIYDIALEKRFNGGIKQERHMTEEMP